MYIHDGMSMTFVHPLARDNVRNGLFAHAKKILEANVIELLSLHDNFSERYVSWL